MRLNCVFYKTYCYVCCCCCFSPFCAKPFITGIFTLSGSSPPTGSKCLFVVFFFLPVFFCFFLSFCDLCVLCSLILKIKKEKKCLKRVLGLTFQCYGWHLSLIQLSFVYYLNTKHYWYILKGNAKGNPAMMQFCLVDSDRFRFVSQSFTVNNYLLTSQRLRGCSISDLICHLKICQCGFNAQYSDVLQL